MIPILNKRSANNLGNTQDMFPGLAGSLKTYLWKMLLGTVEDDSTGPSYYINDAGEIVTIPAESPLYVDAKFWSMGSWDQMCANPYDMLNIPLVGALRSSTGEYFGDFLGVFISGDYHTFGVRAYTSSETGNPSSKQFFSVICKLDTAGKVYITCKDETSVTYSKIYFSGTSFTVVEQTAGTLSGDYFIELSSGVFLVLFSIEWTTPSNSLWVNIGTGGSSTSEKVILFAVPYINELGHIWPFTGPGGTTIASRAGTTNSPMEVGDKLYSLLDGKADGSELITDNWLIEDSNWSIDGDIITVTADATLGFLNHNISIVAGARYEISYEVLTNTLSSNHLGFSSSSAFVDIATEVPFNIGKHVVRLTATNTQTVNSFRLYIGSNTTLGQATVTKFSVREVSPASFKLKFNWTPSFSYSDVPVSTTGCILHGGTQNLVQFRTDASGNGYIDLLDGTHTVSVALDWEAFTSYSFSVLCGDNNALYPGVDKMQLIVDSTASAVSDFDGSFDPDTAMVLGESTDYPQSISPLVFDNVKAEDWE